VAPDGDGSCCAALDRSEGPWVPAANYSSPPPRPPCSAQRAARRGRPPAGDLDLELARFAPSLDVAIASASRTWSGAFVRDVAVGAGERAAVGRTVPIRFRAWRPDRSPIGADTARRFTLTVGSGMAMPGVDERVSGMRIAGRRQLVAPWAAQGRGGLAGVPPGEPIAYDVEVVQGR
jgi:hypothetical protein